MHGLLNQSDFKKYMSEGSKDFTKIETEKRSSLFKNIIMFRETIDNLQQNDIKLFEKFLKK